jgi:hypothetical protein
MCAAPFSPHGRNDAAGLDRRQYRRTAPAYSNNQCPSSTIVTSGDEANICAVKILSCPAGTRPVIQYIIYPGKRYLGDRRHIGTEAEWKEVTSQY